MTMDEFIDEEMEALSCSCVQCKREGRERLVRMWNAAAVSEREECAGIADEWTRACTWEHRRAGSEIAAKIRARGGKW